MDWDVDRLEGRPFLSLTNSGVLGSIRFSRVSISNHGLCLGGDHYERAQHVARQRGSLLLMPGNLAVLGLVGLCTIIEPHKWPETSCINYR